LTSKTKKSQGFNKVQQVWTYLWMPIILCRLSIYVLSYGLTHVILFPFPTYSFFLQDFSNSHKSNSNSCLGLHVKFKSRFGVKHNESCLWSSWCYFMHSIVHQTRLGLAPMIYITSSTYVVTSIHDSRMNKSHCISHSKTKQLVCFVYQTFVNKIKLHNIHNVNLGFGYTTKICKPTSETI
jgi:hypothetical protein